MKCNRRELAELTGHTEKTITTWQNNEGLPVLQVGKRGVAAIYDSVAVIKWLVDRAIAERVGRSLQSGDQKLYDKDEELGRLRHHEADKTELFVRERRGELTETTEVIRLFGERAQRGARMLMRFADDVAEMHLEGSSPKAAKEAYSLLIERVLNTWLDNERDDTRGKAPDSQGEPEIRESLEASC